jgi:hypothetical protein
VKLTKQLPVPYPFLAAIYPALALAAANSSAIMRLGVLLRPLAISFAVPAVVWLALAAVRVDRNRRALVTLAAVMIFCSYGYFTGALGGLGWSASQVESPLPICLLLAYFAAVLYLMFRVRLNLVNLTHYLNIVTVILVAWSATDLIRHSVGRPRLTAQPGIVSRGSSASLNSRSTDPDIYLLVLDKYTGSRSLRRNFGFDNTSFETFLRQRGFRLPRSPHCNYVHTFLSLASLLNYRYLDEVSQREGVNSIHPEYVKGLVEDSAALRFLRARGYRFIFFPTAWAVTLRNRLADLQVPDPQQIPPEFEAVWQSTTLAQPILSWVCKRTSCTHGFGPYRIESPELIDWKFQQLGALPRWPRDGRPLFVFVHAPIPHEPYVYHADCTAREPLWPGRSAQGDETTEKRAYIEQLICTNQKVKGAVEQILKASPRPPIILIQADHGNGRISGRSIPELNKVTSDQVAERADAFAAYYLPGADASIVYDSITPVNVFRTVFRAYFGAPLDRLPDRTYWSSGTRPFEFTEISARLGRP